jgi:hypothetical protein
MYLTNFFIQYKKMPNHFAFYFFWYFIINLIKVEKGKRNNFYYYNIVLNMKDGMELL